MPKVTKCMNGHFYDADRYDTCPYCKSGQDISATRPVSDVPNSAYQPTMPTQPIASSVSKDVSNNLATDVSDAMVTVAKFPGVNGKNPVVGWLVCIDGPLYGEDFRLKAGNNFIGRDSSMDVALRGDASVSRIKHVILTYDPIGNQFIVRPGESHELTYLNHEVLLDARLLKIYDVLSIGSCELMFIPLAGENFVWNKAK